MLGAIFSTGQDTIFLVVPFIAMLLIGMFRLDEIFTSQHRKPRARKVISGLDANGEQLLCDPDGSRWQ
jgi:hypothetical protein